MNISDRLSPFFKNETVLITGHTGFKGSWLSLWLKYLGAKVIGVSNNIPTNPSLFEALNLKKDIVHIKDDIRNTSEIKSIIEKYKPKFVFHLAAESIVKNCIDNPFSAFEVNCMGTISILESIKNFNFVKSVIIVTTDKVYENKDWSYAYRENDQLGGKDPYSASKACAELAVQSYVQTYFKNTETKIATSRAGNVVGGGDWAAFRLIPDCIRANFEGKPLKIRNLNSTRPWQYVLSPLSGYLLLATKLLNNENFNGESFNFGPNEEKIQSVKNVLENIPFKNLEVNLSEEKWVQKEAKLLKLSSSKSQELLNWNCSLSFQKTIEMTFDWYQYYYSNFSNFEKINEYSINQIISFSNLSSI